MTSLGNGIERLGRAVISTSLLSAVVACSNGTDAGTSGLVFETAGVPPGSVESPLVCNTDHHPIETGRQIRVNCPGGKIVYLSGEDSKTVEMEINPIITYVKGSSSLISVEFTAEAYGFQLEAPRKAKPATINFDGYTSDGKLVFRYSEPLGAVRNCGTYRYPVRTFGTDADPMNVDTVKVYGDGGGWENCHDGRVILQDRWFK